MRPHLDHCLSAVVGVAAGGLETDADEGFISIFDSNSFHEWFVSDECL